MFTENACNSPDNSIIMKFLCSIELRIIRIFNILCPICNWMAVVME